MKSGSHGDSSEQRSPGALADDARLMPDEKGMTAGARLALTAACAVVVIIGMRHHRRHHRPRHPRVRGHRRHRTDPRLVHAPRALAHERLRRHAHDHAARGAVHHRPAERLARQLRPRPARLRRRDAALLGLGGALLRHPGRRPQQPVLAQGPRPPVAGRGRRRPRRQPDQPALGAGPDGLRLRLHAARRDHHQPQARGGDDGPRLATPPCASRPSCAPSSR